MKILLDHCVPKRFGSRLTGHEVFTAASQGWEFKKNGELMKSAAVAGFDAMVTVDQNLPYQQSTSDLPLAVVVLLARSNDISDLVVLVEPLLAVLETLQPKSLIYVGRRR
ncbi:MAG: hypothetical protein JNM86_04845 [Phycisphaerae bacterium]|nr:hypothetical protein [Phycisphaerae bacterium]MBN8599123.1 hypothetical protein [Planctomycetota bacterium]